MTYKPRFVNTTIVMDIATGAVLAREGFVYAGPLELCGGPSQQQEDIAAQQQEFYSTMTKDYSTQFANQSAILASLKQSWAPVLAAGINQYGFSKEEDTALRSQATDSTALQYRNAAKSVAGQLATRSGDSVLPSGTDAQIQAGVAETAAGQEASQQLGITKAGYEQGRANYLDATNAMNGVASMYNPTSYSGAATNAGHEAFSSATTNYQEANQWQGMLAGALGSVAQIGLGIATGGLSLPFTAAASSGGLGGGGGPNDMGF